MKSFVAAKIGSKIRGGALGSHIMHPYDEKTMTEKVFRLESREP